LVYCSYSWFTAVLTIRRHNRNYGNFGIYGNHGKVMPELPSAKSIQKEPAKSKRFLFLRFFLTMQREKISLRLNSQV